jgi:hypothetical protein
MVKHSISPTHGIPAHGHSLGVGFTAWRLNSAPSQWCPLSSLSSHNKQLTPTQRYNSLCYSASLFYHSSSSNSFAVGRSLQSSFIIFEMKLLSFLFTSLSVVRENGVVFSFGIFSMINIMDWAVSGSAISAILAGNRPKYLNCSSTTPSTYSSSSRFNPLGWKRLKCPPYMRLISYKDISFRPYP